MSGGLPNPPRVRSYHWDICHTLSGSRLPLLSHLEGARALKVSGGGVEESRRKLVKKLTIFLPGTPSALLHSSEPYSGPNEGGKALYSTRD